jgi:hypothetical protein
MAKVNPLAWLEPDRDYFIDIDVSGVVLDELSSVLSQPLSPKLDQWLREAKDDSVALTLLMVVDEEFFQRPAKAVQQITIDLAKMRDLDPDSPKSPIERLRNGEASFGRVQFQVHTLSNAAGRGAVTFAVWQDHRRPVDEVTASFCVGGSTLRVPCPRTVAAPLRLHGTDSLRMAASGSPGYPDAALHFIGLSESHALGVFRCNTCGWGSDEFVTWPLKESAAQLADDLDNTIRPALQDPLTTDEAFLRHGEALYGLLFDPTTAAVARTKFQDWLNSPPAANAPSRSLFVRLLAGGGTTSYPLPVGLLAVPGPAGKSRFIGFQVRVESPLARQDYQASAACVNRWAVFSPPTDINLPEWGTRIDRVRPWLNSMDGAHSEHPDRVSVFHSVQSFSQWLSPATTPSATSTAVLILSHHDGNRLFFDQNNPGDSLEPFNITRDMKAPSLVILGACGSASANASEFVSTFNSLGVSSAIATSTNITPEMAATYIAALFNNLNADRHTTLAEAHLTALRYVSAEIDPTATERKFGARSLEFMLLGNGAVHVCLPSTK